MMGDGGVDELDEDRSLVKAALLARCARRTGGRAGLPCEVAALLELVLTGLAVDEIVEFVGLDHQGLDEGLLLLKSFANAHGVVLPLTSEASVLGLATSIRVARVPAIERLSKAGYSARQLTMTMGYSAVGFRVFVRQWSAVLTKPGTHRLVDRLLAKPSQASIEQKLLELQRFDDRPGPFPERTTVRVEAIELMAKAGFVKADVAVRMGLSPKSIGRLAERFGIEFLESGKKSTAYVIDEVLKRMVAGESVSSIAKSVGREPSSLQEALRIRGLLRSSESPRTRKGPVSSKPHEQESSG
jgi:hypothetical protein